MYKKISTLFIFSLFLSFSKQMIAQNISQEATKNHECGTEPTSSDISYMENLIKTHEKTERDFLKKTSLRNKSLTYIPIKAHIIRETSGSGGISFAEVNTAIATMNGFYINADIQFYLCDGVNYIDSDDYYDFNSTTDEASMIGTHNVINNINIYFTKTARSNGAKVCGYTRFPASGQERNIIIMDNGCAMNGETLSHEMGHFYGLYHTHGNLVSGTTDELVDGSNCISRGDRICDTPADPNLSGAVNASCIYTGSSVDANMQTYAPDANNVMSYARFGCRTRFSPEQYARINSSALNSRFRNKYSCVSPTDDAGIKDILTPKDNAPYCDNNLTPEVILHNYSASSLTSVSIKYQINNGTVSTYAWNGNLAAQQSITVSLPSIATPNNAAFTFKAFTSNPNTNTDNNNINDELTSTTLKNVNINTSTNNNLISSAADSATYTWLDCNNNYDIISGEIGKQYLATTSGDYAVEVSQNNCIDTSACEKIVITNLDDVFLKNNVRVYPNPNEGIVNINLGNLTNASIKVLNINGQIVEHHKNIKSEVFQFELKEAQGLYFIEVYTKEATLRFKLMKN